MPTELRQESIGQMPQVQLDPALWKTEQDLPGLVEAMDTQNRTSTRSAHSPRRSVAHVREAMQRQDEAVAQPRIMHSRRTAHGTV